MEIITSLLKIHIVRTQAMTIISIMIIQRKNQKNITNALKVVVINSTQR